MRLPILCTGLLALAASVADAAPAAPIVTVGTNDIKQLQFDWDAVPQANRYELWFKANAGASWTLYAQTPAQRPLIRISVSAHLLDWRVARYLVKACNPSGCTASAEVGVDDLALDAMGYLKPNGPGNNHRFGHTVALSADGATMAVLTGETMGSKPDSVVAHVYRRTTTTSGWRREARLVPPGAQANTSQSFEGQPLALSGDGNTLILGVAKYRTAGVGVPPENGAVFLWRREAAGWRLAETFGGASIERNWYGFNVDMDDTAQTIAISHRYESPGQFAGGTVDVFRWRGAPNNFFQHVYTVPVPAFTGTSTAFCAAMSLSGDGKRLFRSCVLDAWPFVQAVDVSSDSTWNDLLRFGYAGNNLGIDSTYDGKTFITMTGSGAGVYVEGPNGWVLDGVLGNNGGSTAIFAHDNCVISRDGKIAALGNWEDNSIGTGPIYPPYASADPGSGAVVVYERKTAGWSLRRLVKPGSTNVQWAGHSVALGNNGKILAVGAPMDASAATGIDGDRDDQTAPERGAVWLY